ncbi:MAG: glycosyltransferase [Nitrosomonadales bacterium]|nr:glycosyltransferase [Nitrosomonadales bacterium]
MNFPVVIPVRNEQDNITPLLVEICAVLDRWADYEVIYVDDGSTDATRVRLFAVRRTYPQLRVLRHAQTSGQSAALMSGVRAARGRWIVTLDGDGQNDPADIPRLLAVVGDPTQPKSLKLVTGHRHRRRDSPLKRVSSRIANGVRGWLLRDHTPDSGCGLKLICRET